MSAFILKIRDLCKVIIRALSGLVNRKLLRNTRIQTRLIVSFLFLSFVPLLVTGVVSYNKSSSAIDSKISTSSVQVMKQLGKNLQLELDKFKRISDELAFNDIAQKGLAGYSKLSELEKMDFINSMNKQLTSAFASASNILAACVIPNDGSVISYGNLPDIENEFFKNIRENAKDKKGSPSWHIYSDESTNTKGLVFSRVISSMSLSENLGVIIIIIDEKNFSDLYKDLDLGNGSEIFILDSKGTTVSSLNPEMEFGREYENAPLVKELVKGEDSGFFMQKASMAVFSAIEGSDWYVVGTIPTEYLNSESKSLRNTIIFIGFVCLILALVTSFIISRSISNPLKNLVKLMKEGKNGNLAIHIIDTSRDEIGVVISNFNDMVANIRQLLLNIRESNEKVLANSEKMAISSENSYNASAQIACTIQEVARGTEQQAFDANESVVQMENLSCKMNMVGDDMNKVSGVVLDARKLSEEALVTVQSLNEKTSETSIASEKIISDINSLNSDMKQIRNIVKVIVGITDQTNLLSLNAAIEAARAGEAGRGFAVVADEVKKLASHSKEASTMISDIISSIQQKTEHAVSAANNSRTIINEEVETVQKTDTAFQIIFREMSELSTHIIDTSNTVKDSQIFKQKTMSSIENISAISQETASSMEEVSASTEEQMAGSEELSTFAKELNSLARKMDTAISVFKIE